MQKFLFLIKSTGASTLIAISIGVLSGLVLSSIKPEHAHQVFPNWLMLGALTAIAGFFVSVICSTVLVFLNKQNLKLEIIISGILILVANIFILFMTIIH